MSFVVGLIWRNKQLVSEPLLKPVVIIGWASVTKCSPIVHSILEVLDMKKMEFFSAVQTVISRTLADCSRSTNNQKISFYLFISQKIYFNKTMKIYQHFKSFLYELNEFSNSDNPKTNYWE